MKIDCLVLGPFETNCYVLRDETTAKDCLIIDPGLGANRLLSFIKQYKFDPVAVILTHGHIDHIASVAQLRSSFPRVKVYVHKLDAVMLGNPHSNLATITGETLNIGPPDFTVEDGSIVDKSGIQLKVLHTPGHTPGGICLYSKNEGVVFTNDTLFTGSIGRTDFPGGSEQQLLKSIRDKLLTLPGDTIVYPGHGPNTKIAAEKTYNQLLQ
jgi:glyoxylase-like metal-dependent hydrolase (beta-lactamase superfamily II)